MTRTQQLNNRLSELLQTRDYQTAKLLTQFLADGQLAMQYTDVDSYEKAETILDEIGFPRLPTMVGDWVLYNTFYLTKPQGV